MYLARQMHPEQGCVWDRKTVGSLCLALEFDWSCPGEELRAWAVESMTSAPALALALALALMPREPLALQNFIGR